MANIVYENMNTGLYVFFKEGVKSVKNIDGTYDQNNYYYKRMGRSSGPLVSINDQYLSYPPLPAKLNNKLYGKLRDELVGQKGELLTAAVEWKTSLDMISGRARTIGSAFLAVKKFQFKKAATILKIATPSKYKNLTKQQAKAQGLLPTGVWLEYWMGWAPMIGDITHAMDTLQKGPSTEFRHFRVGAGLDDTKVIVTNNSSQNLRRTIKTEQRFAAYGDVLVTNHNKQLANQLGMTNPFLTAWQVLPFFFYG